MERPPVDLGACRAARASTRRTEVTSPSIAYCAKSGPGAPNTIFSSRPVRPGCARVTVGSLRPSFPKSAASSPPGPCASTRINAAAASPSTTYDRGCARPDEAAQQLHGHHGHGARAGGHHARGRVEGGDETGARVVQIEAAHRVVQAHGVQQRVHRGGDRVIPGVGVHQHHAAKVAALKIPPRPGRGRAPAAPPRPRSPRARRSGASSMPMRVASCAASRPGISLGDEGLRVDGPPRQQARRAGDAKRHARAAQTARPSTGTRARRRTSARGVS